MIDIDIQCAAQSVDSQQGCFFLTAAILKTPEEALSQSQARALPLAAPPNARSSQIMTSEITNWHASKATESRQKRSCREITGKISAHQSIDYNKLT